MWRLTSNVSSVHFQTCSDVIQQKKTQALLQQWTFWWTLAILHQHIRAGTSTTEILSHLGSVLQVGLVWSSWIIWTFDLDSMTVLQSASLFDETLSFVAIYWPAADLLVCFRILFFHVLTEAHRVVILKTMMKLFKFFFFFFNLLLACASTPWPPCFYTFAIISPLSKHSTILTANFISLHGGEHVCCHKAPLLAPICFHLFHLLLTPL